MSDEGSSSGESRGLSKAPLILLGVLTVAAFAGPFGILWVLRGGASPIWPPDRAVEWVTFAGTVGLVVVLVTACSTAGWWARRDSSVDRRG